MRALHLFNCGLVGVWLVATPLRADDPEVIEAEDPALSREEFCATITRKSANSETLTPAEGDALIACFFPDDLLEGSPTREGFQAYQPPPSLYDQQDFINVPGVLGGGMVNG
ncbi:hypothetical protein [uncultured Tateyamaria sp.]|uniref:hypothetical protein n=1 Tax=uncultured Tateyamaria sp. TaxID=455651 RepID=UPI00260BECAA|nr:hypothetical protein [uncultured Tateyamaria sp.]